jgi:uncharacterized protein
VSVTIPPVIRCFLLKVASRCNLACDYCYMYEHADQLWRNQPHFMSPEIARSIAMRISEYVAEQRLPDVSVVFHGGEPLLFGAQRLVDMAGEIKRAMPGSTRCDVSLQTNGNLLTAEAVDAFAEADIGVSVSLDGPASINDLHRLTPTGRSSHEQTERALAMLSARPEIFAGAIAVIDPSTEPRDVLSYFAQHRVPALDLLLPDATHTRQPQGRDADPDLYSRWLTRAFDVWFDEFPELPVRTFDSLLGSVCGLPSPTDAFGLGNVSLLTVETDGSYHDLDVLKITREGRTALGMNVRDHTIAEACTSTAFIEHSRLLSLDGLSADCRSCPEVRVCGGGAVPHRYGDDGFDHPSVYCMELLAMIRHVRRRLTDAVTEARPVADMRRTGAGIDLAVFESADAAKTQVALIKHGWAEEASAALTAALGTHADRDSTDKSVAELLGASTDQLLQVAVTPSAVLWTRLTAADASGRPLRTLNGGYLQADAVRPASLSWLLRHCDEPRPYIHRDDELLRLPFGDPIVFLPYHGISADSGRTKVSEALGVIGDYSAGLLAEIRALCTDIQLVKDTAAHPDKAVSFSDDSVPGALYVAPATGQGELGLVDLADSIIHEHRHQKLYLLCRAVDLVATDRPLVRSPWREEPRPPSGVLHAVFVFAELRAFWDWVQAFGPTSARERARQEVDSITKRLQQGLTVLDSTALTPAGKRLAAILANRAGLYP